PNPFSDQTNISYTLGKEASVQISIIDILGKDVLTRDLGMIPAGEHNTTINNQDLSPGIYFYTLTAGGNSQTRKMIFE
ncbi:MAG: T9SS type A sorting domain-containing protein, partial [candidate division Zixibacteria bacterium]|nr:T9SS type A sorting domain-containing protein [candidate division Zixibacteria bacterium]